MREQDVSPEVVGAIQFVFYGHKNVPKKSDFDHAWKAIKVVAAADGHLSETERLHLLGKMAAIGTPADVVAAVMDFDVRFATCEALVAGIDVPAELRPGTGAWVVYEALSVAMADGDLSPGEWEGVRRTAAAMGVPEPTVDALAEQVRQELALRERRLETLASTIPTAFRFGS
jgi:tellurite resistance protein